MEVCSSDTSPTADMKTLKTLSDTEFQALFPVLEGVPSAEITRLRAHTHKCAFKRRDTLMKQGEPGCRVLFLAHGRIKIVTSGHNAQGDISQDRTSPGDGPQTVVSFCGHGELLGEINALTPGGHSADVIAEEACFAWSMTVEDFLRCLAEMPRLSMNISRLLARRTRKATEQLHIVATMSAEQRVAYNLDSIACTTGMSGTPPNPTHSNEDAAPSVTVADLSSMCGCSSKHVQRALKKLREAGLIERAKGRVRVLDPESLKAYALGKL